MKRHVQLPGVRKWTGDDLLELQSQPMTALDSFFEQYGNCIINGCQIDTDTGNITPGLVALGGTDHEGKATFKVVPFSGTTAVSLFPVYLTLTHTVVERDYDDSVVRPVAYEYAATFSETEPAVGVSYIVLGGQTDVQFVDVIQDAAHRFMTDTQINAITTALGNMLTDAPTDGKPYVRSSGTWNAIKKQWVGAEADLPTERTDDTIYYVK